MKQKAADVDPKTDPELPKLVKAMAQAMYDAPGVGLAATQVGVLKRVVIIDIDDGLMVLCNPRIVQRSEETEIDEEGCLSLPGISVPVERCTSCTCEALSLSGKPVSIRAEGLLAIALQHETDHLDGVLIIDRATPDERRAAIRRYREAQEQR